MNIINFIKNKYFTPSEFACKCGCRIVNVSDGFIIKLGHARAISGIPYNLSSGCRCQNHNDAIGGHPNSLHIASEIKECEAVDIKYKNANEMALILIGLFKANFTHVGISGTFIHVDNSKKTGSWTY